MQKSSSIIVGKTLFAAILLVILGSIIFGVILFTKNQKKILLDTWEKAVHSMGNLIITYPYNETLFPPDLMTAPIILWEDKTNTANQWLIVVYKNKENPFITERTEKPAWKPDRMQWEIIKNRSLAEPICITAIGYRGREILSEGSTSIRTSTDSVNAPIFYRAVPLPFDFALKHLETIQWRLGDIASEDPPTLMLSDLPLCGNCHSFTSDGNTLAMDVDYANDKGSYVISQIEKQTLLTSDKIITWSDYRPSSGKTTFGLLSQISPDGCYVASTVKDRSIFVAKDNLSYSQLFFPIKGILVIYDRVTKTFQALPGADNPDWVQSNPCWSPDGKTIYFARAPVYHSVEAEKSDRAVLPTSVAAEFIEGRRGFQYDIYRIPFNNGKGGKAEPVPGASNNGMSNYFPRISPDGKWLVFTQAKNFMLLQPDSRLYIVSTAGGKPREMNCNTGAMNSWHSWSPNGKWLVFSSKLHGPYTSFLLTHIDENGMDTPSVYLENLSLENRAGNIPEFVNLNPQSWEKIEDRFTNQSHYYFTVGRYKMGEEKYDEAIQHFNKAIEMDASNVDAYVFRGHVEFTLGDYRKAIDTYDQAIQLKADNKDIFINKGTSLYKLNRFQDAIKAYTQAIAVNPKDLHAHFARGLSKAKVGDLEGAIDDFDKTITFGSKSADVYYERGLCKALKGNLTPAIRDFQTAAKLNPKEVRALEKLGDSYYKLKKFKDAIRAYDSALQLTSNNSELYSYRALCKFASHDFNGALNDYNTAIQLDPNSGVDYCQRGLLKIRMGEKASGCEDLYKARALGFAQAGDEIRRHCMQ